jgi:hypothetical protein
MCSRAVPAHLPVKPHECVNTPPLQQQRQPSAPVTGQMLQKKTWKEACDVQPVRVPHHRVTRHWHSEDEDAVGLDERAHLVHGAEVAAGVDGVAVAAEAVVLEVGDGDDEVEARALGACVGEGGGGGG